MFSNSTHLSPLFVPGIQQRWTHTGVIYIVHLLINLAPIQFWCSQFVYSIQKRRWTSFLRSLTWNLKFKFCCYVLIVQTIIISCWNISIKIFDLEFNLPLILKPGKYTAIFNLMGTKILKWTAFIWFFIQIYQLQNICNCFIRMNQRLTNIQTSFTMAEME